MKKRSAIVVRTQFEGWHQYNGAPQPVAYLKNLHRHIFHVEVVIDVNHNNRELEFILVKDAINTFIKSQPFDITASCEQMATMICEYLISVYGERNMQCSVYEDNENGGRVYYEF